MGWFAEQLKARKENNQRAFENSFMDLAGLNDAEANATRDDFIVKQLTKYFGYPELNLPQGLKTLSDKIDYTLKNIGILGRKIELTGTWALDNRDPILVFTKNNKIPILMLPKGTRGYYSVSYVTGKKFKSTATISKKLRTEAYAFYKPLPTHKLTFKEYFQYFRKSVRLIDLIGVALMSIIVTGFGMLTPYITKSMTGTVVNDKDMKLYAMMTIFLISSGVGFVLIITV